MTDNDSEDREWSMERIEETLMEMNDEITGDGLSEVTLSGNIGFHIFAENDEENPVTGVSKLMHVAFDQAIQELWVDVDMVRDYHGEVTPKTVCATIEDQLNDFLGHGGLDEAFLLALAQEMDVEADVMSPGKMFSGGEAPDAF